MRRRVVIGRAVVLIEHVIGVDSGGAFPQRCDRGVEEGAAGPARPVHNDGGVPEVPGGIARRHAKSRIVETQFGKRLAGVEREVLRDEVGLSRRELLRVAYQDDDDKHEERRTMGRAYHCDECSLSVASYTTRRLRNACRHWMNSRICGQSIVWTAGRQLQARALPYNASKRLQAFSASGSLY